ncbi:hypothetical protein [Alistipes ihumii]
MEERRWHGQPVCPHCGADLRTSLSPDIGW